MALQVVEICAGGGGQASGLEASGFAHAVAVEIEKIACETLRANGIAKVVEADVGNFDGSPWRGVDLFAGGVPCPPFSVAGKQLGGDDERDLFPVALRLIEQIKPRAILLENVQGFASAKFEAYRNDVLLQLTRMGYVPDWKILHASDFGVPQLRPRFVLVALRPDARERFRWPTSRAKAPTVGEALCDLMAERGWPGAARWVARASKIAPTIVGGSKKHGGPDLGPTRARQQWAELGVNGIGIADFAPDDQFPMDEAPKLTVGMAARLQGFSESWKICGRKTAAYRQVGNAFPPPVARALGNAIRAALTTNRKGEKSEALRPFQPALL
jgi:DNA (cytosine-5)-methyltransferase 1